MMKKDEIFTPNLSNNIRRMKGKIAGLILKVKLTNEPEQLSREGWSYSHGCRFGAVMLKSVL